MTVFVVDGFQISQDSSLMGDSNNNNKDDCPGAESGSHLDHLGHFKLETSLPEVRLDPGNMEADSLKPVLPPKPANIKIKLLEYKQAKEEMKCESERLNNNSSSGVTTVTTTVINSDRDLPQKLGNPSRHHSRIPIFKGRRPHIKSENIRHRICLKIENSKVEEEDVQADISLTSQSRAGSCSGRATPASLIPRPCQSLSVSLMSLSGASEDSLEVECRV